MENLREKYDGRIYENERAENGFVLRFNSGSFHYVGADVLKMAYEQGFAVGWHKKVYGAMPWGMCHVGYEFCESDLCKDSFFERFIKLK